MSIFKRHKDLDELKRAVQKNDDEISQPMPMENIPIAEEHQRMKTQPDFDFSNIPSVPAMIHNSLEKKEEFAPLFVKIEKYREIVASVQETKTFIYGIRQLFAIMNDLEAARSEALNMMRVSVQRLEKSVEWVDQSLLRPIGFEELPHGEMEVKHIERSLGDLQREITSLRRELDKIA